MARADRQARRRRALEWAQEKLVGARAKFWNVYGRYWNVRNQIAQDPKLAALVVGAVSAISTPVGGAIAAAAIGIDRKLAPAMQDLAGSREAVALLIIDEMVQDGRLTEAEAERMASQTIQILEESAGVPETVPRRRNYAAISSGPGRQTWSGGTPIADTGPTIEPWQIAALAAGLYLVLS
jgi:hypothetical protein